MGRDARGPAPAGVRGRRRPKMRRASVSMVGAVEISARSGVPASGSAPLRSPAASSGRSSPSARCASDGALASGSGTGLGGGGGNDGGAGGTGGGGCSGSGSGAGSGGGGSGGGAGGAGDGGSGTYNGVTAGRRRSRSSSILRQSASVSRRDSPSASTTRSTCASALPTIDGQRAARRRGSPAQVPRLTQPWLPPVRARRVEGDAPRRRKRSRPPRGT